MSYFCFGMFLECKDLRRRRNARRGTLLGARIIVTRSYSNIGDELEGQSTTEVRRCLRLEILPKFSDRPTFRHPTAGR